MPRASVSESNLGRGVWQDTNVRWLMRVIGRQDVGDGPSLKDLLPKQLPINPSEGSHFDRMMKEPFYRGTQKSNQSWGCGKVVLG